MNRLKKVLLLTLGTVLLCLVAPGAKAQTSDAGTSSPTKHPPNVTARLRLTTTVTKEQYCDDDTVPRLSWWLRLTFTNAGTEPIILDKKSSLILRTLISRTAEAAAAREYVEESSYYKATRHPSLRGSRPDQAFFQVLQAGESYSVETDLGVMLYDGSDDTADDLHPGSYVLQLRVGTWYYFDPSQPYREEWANKGFLWSETITSEPMPFTVRQQQIVTRCDRAGTASVEKKSHPLKRP